MTKTCSKCNLTFDDSFFTKGRFVCKDCRSVIRRDSYAAKSDDKKKEKGNKKCSECEEEKDVEFFKVGSSKCDDCNNKKRRETRASKKSSITDEEIIPCHEGHKVCNICKTAKILDEFRVNRRKCKKCENVERVAYKKGEIQKQPIPEIEEEDDFSKQLKASCRIRIRETLPKDYAQKITDENRFGYIYELLGCNMDFLKSWFRFNYSSEMTDENYGTYWMMDHIIPIKSFKIQDTLEENKKCCYSWFNISPMQSTANLKKFVTIDKILIHSHKEKLIKFCQQNKIEPDNDYLLLCAKHLDAGNPLESSTTTHL